MPLLHTESKEIFNPAPQASLIHQIFSQAQMLATARWVPLPFGIRSREIFNSKEAIPEAKHLSHVSH